MLPTLRSRIYRSFLVILALNWALALLLLAAFFSASGLPPKLMRRNYDSIAAVHKIRQAWDSILHPLSLAAQEDARRTFETQLRFEEGNITEPGEGQTV